MFGWLAAAAGLLVVGFTLKRLFPARTTRSKQIDVGEVSQGWIVGHRADRSDR
jgi:hypothetical protein